MQVAIERAKVLSRFKQNVNETNEDVLGVIYQICQTRELKIQRAAEFVLDEIRGV